MVKIGKSAKIYPGVKIGKNSTIYDFVIIGFPPKTEHRTPNTEIGDGAIIRPFTTIYTGNKIGNNFQTGQGVTIRENNIIGDNVSIGTNTVIEVENKIGSGTRIHSSCFLELVEIEENVFIGPGTVFLDDPHPPCPKYRECLGGAKVKKFAKIGGGCIILPGVTIGEHALVGAGACVTKDVPARTVVIGNPAQVTKRIDELKCYPGIFKRPYTWKPYKLLDRDRDLR
ncbi:transferase [candidate division WOR-3 bacterium]|nr:transferase [candidate division WOR-3 bacterium]